MSDSSACAAASSCSCGYKNISKGITRVKKGEIYWMRAANLNCHLVGLGSRCLALSTQCRSS